MTLLNTLHQSMRRSPPAVALALWLALLGHAAAQDLQSRAVALVGESAYGSDEEAWSALEVTTVRSHLLTSAAPLAGQEGRTSDELAGLHYRVWLTRGRADVGIGLGTLGFVLAPSIDGPRALVGARPVVTLGLRYRMSDQHQLFADASGARGLGADPAAAYVATRVGLEWKPAKSSIGLAHGALGVQLDSGYRLSLKVRHGKPALYLRTQF